MWWFSSEFRATLFSDKPVCMCVLSTSSSWTQAGENQRLPSWVQLSQVYPSHLQWSPQKTSGGWAPPKKNRKVVEKWETWKYVENLWKSCLSPPGNTFVGIFFGLKRAEISRSRADSVFRTWSFCEGQQTGVVTCTMLEMLNDFEHTSKCFLGYHPSEGSGDVCFRML